LREVFAFSSARASGELRKEKGWTQFEMSERVGMDRSYLAEVETGKIEICLRNLELIAQSFDMETWELLRIGNRKTSPKR
jgi:transcriptional regulator with XRE-family HTH domain